MKRGEGEPVITQGLGGWAGPASGPHLQTQDSSQGVCTCGNADLVAAAPASHRGVLSEHLCRRSCSRRGSGNTRLHGRSTSTLWVPEVSSPDAVQVQEGWERPLSTNSVLRHQGYGWDPPRRQGTREAASPVWPGSVLTTAGEALSLGTDGTIWALGGCGLKSARGTPFPDPFLPEVPTTSSPTSTGVLSLWVLPSLGPAMAPALPSFASSAGSQGLSPGCPQFPMHTHPSYHHSASPTAGPALSWHRASCTQNRGWYTEALSNFSAQSPLPHPRLSGYKSQALLAGSTVTT